ncbi:MAG: hypothetical protein GYA87_07535 [Christensenellaceae bacterium]|nr:hypothetical protein [Christensenellaceae bacterium]
MSKKIISIILISVLLTSIIPFGATEPIETVAPMEQSAPVEVPALGELPPQEEQAAPTDVPAPLEDTPAPTEAPAEQALTEEPAPTEQATEQPVPTEEPTTAPVVEEPSSTEQPTQEPQPSPSIQANVVDKTGWENHWQKVYYYPDEVGVGNSFQVNLGGVSGGTGKYTYAYYIYHNNTVVEKSAYTKNDNYKYTPKKAGKYHAIVFVKNEKGEIITITSDTKVNVVELTHPLKVIAYTTSAKNIVLGDAIYFQITSEGGVGSQAHMHTYYVYKNNQVIEKFPYKQVGSSDFDFYNAYSYSSQVEYIPKAPGKYKFVAFAKDAAGNATSYTTDEFLVRGSELHLRANLINTNIRFGEVAQIIAEASGGSGEYQYAYYVYKDNAIIERFYYTENAQFNYTPKSTGTYMVRVFVKDSLGDIKIDNTQDFTVESSILNVGPVHIDGYNGKISCRAYPEGGVAPYTYAYYIYKDKAIIEKTSYLEGISDPEDGFFGECEYIPKSSGTYKITVFVKDAEGTIKIATSPDLEFNNDITIWINPQIEANIYLGNAINCEMNASYGEGFYKYAYYIYKDNAILQKMPYTNNAKLVYTPESTGIYKILVFVKDDAGKIVYAMSNECTVNSSEALKINSVNIPEVSLPNCPIKVESSVNGGIKPYQCAHYIYQNNNIIKKTNYSEYDEDFNFIATSPGNYHVIAFVKDATGGIAYRRSNTCVVSNNPQPSNYQEMNIQTSFYNETSKLTLRADVTGGVKPYQYAYYIYKDGERIKIVPYQENNIVIDYNITESGTYKVIVFVRDYIGKIKSCTTQDVVFNLSAAPNIVELKFHDPWDYANPNPNIELGEYIRVRMTIENADDSKIAYNFYRNGVLYYKSNFRKYSDFHFIPKHTGTYTVQAVVRSSGGEIVSEVSSNYCTVNVP